MPKENINDMITDGFRLEVAWNLIPGSGYVQVASVNRSSELTLPGDNPGEPDQQFDGWRVTLDRDGINRAIRSLRRARDAAFGRDE